MQPLPRPTASTPYWDAELVEGMLAFEFGGGNGENAMAVISEGFQSTKRHRWTEKLVRSNGAVIALTNFLWHKQSSTWIS
jgi:hypothetical protein